MSAVTLELFVSDIAATLASFDVIEIQRSVTDENGPFEDLTKIAPASSASILGTITGPFAAVGQTLSVILDSGAQVDVVFTGSSPLTTAQVVGQINTALSATIATDDGNAVRLTSTLTGTASKLEIVGGSAVATLGFTASDRVIGLEAQVPLVVGQQSYTFTDNDGAAGYFYRARFFSTVSGLFSAWSDPFEGSPGTQVSAGSLCLISIDLVDAEGRARADQRIVFYPISTSTSVEGFAVGLGHKPIIITTDNSGHAEVSLVRGLDMRVVFEGTSLVRDIAVPAAATADLLGLISSAPDIFDVSEQALPAAPRRTI